VRDGRYASEMRIVKCPPFRTCEYLPSLLSFFRFSIQSGTLNWRGFCTMVTRRSTSSAVNSPALRPKDGGTRQYPAPSTTVRPKPQAARFHARRATPGAGGRMRTAW